jgi:vancomycin permeability regulator SanA
MITRILRGLRAHWKKLITVAVVVVCLGLAPVGWAYASTAAHRASADDVPVMPVGLVLGAGVRPDGTPSLSLKGRIDVAADLYRRGKVKVLLASGDNRVKDYDEPTVMRDHLIRRGVPARRIVRDYAGRDTWDSCTRAKRVFGVERLTVISQNWHLPRAVALCEAAGLEAWGVGDDLWIRGATEVAYVREPVAMMKAMIDVVLRPDPAVLGRPEPGVREALATP